MFRIPSLLLIASTAAGCVGAGLSTPAWAPVPPPREGEMPPVRNEEVRDLLARESLGADDLVRLAEALNPGLAAAEAAAGEAAGRQWQASLHPNPTLELETEDVPSERVSLGQGSNSAALVHPVSLSGRRGHEAAALGAEREAAALAREASARAVRREARSLFAEALFLRLAEEEAATALEQAGTTLEVARKRLEARAATEAEVARLRIEVEEMALERAALARRGPVLEARIRELLGGAAVPLDRLQGTLDAGLPPLDSAAVSALLHEHPALRAARLAVTAADRRVDQREAERLPDLDLRVAYGRTPAERGNFVEAGVAIPLPLYDRGQGRVLEAEFASARARRERDALEGRLRTAAAEAIGRYDTARAETEALRDRVVPDAERALEGTRDAWRAGRAALADLLDAQRTAARARRALLESIRDAHLAREALRELLGGIPGEEEAR